MTLQTVTPIGGSSDDTAAIQAAVDTGEPVYLDGATFLIKTGPVYIPSGVEIYGNGETGTTLDCSGSTIGLALDTGNESGAVENVHLHDFLIRDASVANIDIDGTGASGAGVRESYLERIRTWHSTGDGLRITACWNSSFKDVSAYSNDGWGINAFGNAQALTFLACQATSNGNGIHAGTRCTYVGATCEGNTGYDLHADTVSQITIIGGYLEAISGSAIDGRIGIFIEDCEGVSIVNFPMETLPGDSVRIDNSTGVTIDGGAWSADPMTTTEYPYSLHGHTSLAVVNGSEVTISGFWDMPIWVDGTSRVFRPEAARQTKDYLYGAGRTFATTVLRGAPTVVAETWGGREGRKVTTTANWQGLNVPIGETLEAGETYTLGCWVNLGGGVGSIIGFEAGTGSGAIAANTPSYNATNVTPWDRPRFAVSSFVADGAETHVGIYANTSGAIMQIAGMELVKGDWHAGNWPRAYI